MDQELHQLIRNRADRFAILYGQYVNRINSGFAPMVALQMFLIADQASATEALSTFGAYVAGSETARRMLDDALPER